MTDFFQMVVSGIAVGSTYALMGLAMVIIYKTSEVPNFAQGEIALLPSFIAFMLLDQMGFSYITSPCRQPWFLPSLLGAFLEFAILRRAKEPNILGLIIITIGMEMTLLGFVSWKFGADQRRHVLPRFKLREHKLGGLFISSLDLLTLVVALVIMMTFLFFFRVTPSWGWP